MSSKFTLLNLLCDNGLDSQFHLYSPHAFKALSVKVIRGILRMMVFLFFILTAELLTVIMLLLHSSYQQCGCLRTSGGALGRYPECTVPQQQTHRSTPGPVFTFPQPFRHTLHVPGLTPTRVPQLFLSTCLPAMAQSHSKDCFLLFSDYGPSLAQATQQICQQSNRLKPTTYSPRESEYQPWRGLPFQSYPSLSTLPQLYTTFQSFLYLHSYTVFLFFLFNNF